MLTSKRHLYALPMFVACLTLFSAATASASTYEKQKITLHIVNEFGTSLRVRPAVIKGDARFSMVHRPGKIRDGHTRTVSAHKNGNGNARIELSFTWGGPLGEKGVEITGHFCAKDSSSDCAPLVRVVHSNNYSVQLEQRTFDKKGSFATTKHLEATITISDKDNWMHTFHPRGFRSP